MEFISRLLGITRLRYEQKKTNLLLENLNKELKRNSDLVEKYNKHYHIN